MQSVSLILQKIGRSVRRNPSGRFSTDLPYYAICILTQSAGNGKRKRDFPVEEKQRKNRFTRAVFLYIIPYTIFMGQGLRSRRGGRQSSAEMPGGKSSPLAGEPIRKEYPPPASREHPPCGARKTVRTHAVPPVFRPLRKFRVPFFRHRRREPAIPFRQGGQ